MVLFIDELHTIVGAGGASGSLDASNMFKPALARGELQCIGATTLDEYRMYIEKDGALERRFQKNLSTSPYKEIQRNRVKRVINMLLNTDYTLEVISETLEFSEAANMAALFKKVTGSSPGDYRRTH